MCMERHDHLIESAFGRSELRESLEDLKRLRPGEIDPNPETKPAKPDSIDMDDDGLHSPNLYLFLLNNPILFLFFLEREMLSEAISRLANTKGKKAKRHSRERQLIEARRLASIQRQREMKASGIDVAELLPTKKPRGIDYRVEMPLPTAPPPSAYDTSDPSHMHGDDRQFLNKIISQEDSVRVKKREKAAKERAADQKKLRKLAEQDLPALVRRREEQRLEAQLADQQQHSLVLSLPEPQVSEAEMGAIARTSLAQMRLTRKALSGGDEGDEEEDDADVDRGTLGSESTISQSVTDVLVQGGLGAATGGGGGSGSGGAIMGSSSNPSLQLTGPGMTPHIGLGSVRNARTVSRDELLKQQARDLHALMTAPTPLLGGKNAPLTSISLTGQSTALPQVPAVCFLSFLYIHDLT